MMTADSEIICAIDELDEARDLLRLVYLATRSRSWSDGDTLTVANVVNATELRVAAVRERIDKIRRAPEIPATRAGASA